MDILKKIWEAPVFIYQLNALAYIAVGEEKAWNVIDGGQAYGAYCVYYAKTLDELVNQSFLGSALGEEIIKTVERYKNDTPMLTDYSEFEKKCMDCGFEEESIEKQFEKISELRKRLDKKK